MRIAILEAGAPHASLEHHGRFSSWFTRLLGPVLDPVEFMVFRAYDRDLPGNPKDFDGFIVTGSSASVHDPEPWIALLSDFLKRTAQTRPTLGVCFGHQLLHQVFGGRVAPLPQGWGVGVHHYSMTGWLQELHPGKYALSLVASHREHVVQPAAGTRILGSSEFCPIAISQIGSSILTVQAHPAATKSLAKELYEYRRALIGADAVERAVKSLLASTDEAVFTNAAAAFFRKAG